MNLDQLAIGAVLGTFGEAATWSGGTVRGVFDSRHYPTGDGSGATVSQLETTFTVRDTDAAPAVGEGITIRGVAYTVSDRRPDNLGAIILVLGRA